jgi:SAM-dependent methyltransferase
MEPWKVLEFEYAKRLRESISINERKRLYTEAYSAVSILALQRFSSDKPEERTAGTSKSLVKLLSKIVDKNDDVLEIGCGRGYTCLMLAPYVKSMVGIEVSDSAIMESMKILLQDRIGNAEIKQVSAIDIDDNFESEEFSVCLSIDVFEHLHPDDAREHLAQVFQVLRPGGRYIIIMPNRLTGPHDITRTEFPDAKEALGFHLNESTYKEVIELSRTIGFDKFLIFCSLRIPGLQTKPIILPYQFGIIAEIVFRILPPFLRLPVIEKVLSIRLIAYKPLNVS